jgi:D-galactarolactone isomerase
MEPTRNTRYPGACDCHVHIYEDRFPLIPNVAWVPPHSPVSAYRAQVQEPLGIDRAVVVQPTGYGFDNSCTLDALAQFGNARAASRWWRPTWPMPKSSACTPAACAACAT